MTMESTVPSTEAIDNTARYPLDPLTGAEIETAAAVITDSEYATPTLKSLPSSGIVRTTL